MTALRRLQFQLAEEREARRRDEAVAQATIADLVAALEVATAELKVGKQRRLRSILRCPPGRPRKAAAPARSWSADCIDQSWSTRRIREALGQ